jgi:hypothetical protein
MLKKLKQNKAIRFRQKHYRAFLHWLVHATTRLSELTACIKMTRRVDL